MPHPDVGDISRRRVIAGLPVATALSCLVGACASAQSPPRLAGSPTSDGRIEIESSKVPLGAVVVVSADHPMVVAQPAPGKFVAFSAACTHVGSIVSAKPGSTMLVCPSHGAQYDGMTGRVVRGPAKSPLAPIRVASVNGVLTLG